MSNRNHSSGISLIIISVIVVVCALDYWYDRIFDKPERDIKENKEFVEEWKSQNINYFQKFNCPNLNENKESLKINKFYAFWTGHDIKCDEIKKMFYKFSNSRYGIKKLDIEFKKNELNMYQTEIIDSSNVLIWIKTIPGEIEGSYEGGSRAIRLNSEINFIETKTNTIYKKIIVNGKGNPQSNVREGYTEKSKDYYFGTYSLDNISKVIEQELSN
ncbi:MAG: hypothetical protein E6Q89_00425 [Bacteroidia bacterium]|nr:MAG: hypothetical protein E6Q89_00425 [Bacteroidia bacterium]